jgi:hypothetical protein
MMDDELTDEQRRLIKLVRAIPGVNVTTGNRCRAVKPCGPEVHNIFMVECKGMLSGHEGKHSWEW